MKKVKFTKVKYFTMNIVISILPSKYFEGQTAILYSGKRKKANFVLKLFFTSFVSLSLIQIWYEFTRNKTAKSSNLNVCAINYNITI